jgi:hypothetical protein
MTSPRGGGGLGPATGTRIRASATRLLDRERSSDLSRRTTMTNTWGEFLQQRIAGGDGGDDRIDAGLLHELRNLAPLRFLHDGDHGAVITGASGAAGTM